MDELEFYVINEGDIEISVDSLRIISMQSDFSEQDLAPYLDTESQSWYFDGSSLSYTEKGYTEGTSLVLPSGEFSFGPYASLPKGSYHVVFRGSGFQEAEHRAVRFPEDLTINDLEKTDMLISFQIDLDEDFDLLEFYVVNHGETPLVVDSLKIISLQSPGDA